MLKSLLNFKAGLLAFEIAFIFVFFTGIFWTNPFKQSNQLRLAVYNEKSWFYINRGLPISWSGVSVVDKEVPFPIIKAPFIIRDKENHPFVGENKFNKIIDLSIFLPLSISMFLIVYFSAFFFGKAADENKNLNFILIPIYIILVLICIFVYFFWFPRI